ncbi:MAG: twin-arginine translocase subunit TatC [Chlorobiota bacterium]|nr:MAG: twin-arginine translocase subunit TatC [Chlorobiota bacterium]
MENENILDSDGKLDSELTNEMGFFDHLEELRGKIIKSLFALILCSTICGVFYRFIIEKILLGPANNVTPPIKMQNFEPMGQITMAIQVVMFSGLILSIPFIIWQFWQFVKPGLYKREQKYIGAIAIATIFCFLLGVVFAYFLLIPTSLEFTSKIEFGTIENRFSISSYFSFVLGFLLACGVVFEMPVISYALSRLGIVTPPFLRHYWRHAVVVILIVSAIITPTPDPINCLFLAIPLYGLYEISILVSKLALKSRTISNVNSDLE